MSALTLTPTNAVTDTVRPSTGKYRFMLGDGTNGTTLGTLYRMDSAGAMTALTYSDEQAQDAIGALFADSNQLDFTYNDAGNADTARVLEPVQPVVTGANKVYASTDIGRVFRRSNGGAAMADTLPTLTAADNGFVVRIQNLETAVAATLTISGAGGETFGETGATSNVIKYGCRQTYVWDGNTLSWRFDAGNTNLLKTYAGAVAGDLLTILDAAAVGTTKASAAQVAAASALVTSSLQGAMASADFSTIANFRTAMVNILDYGADRTGVLSSATALTNAIAALPNGGIVFFPPGTYNLGNTNYTVSAAHITLRGAARYNTNIVTTSTTTNILTLDQYYQCVEDLTFIGPGSGQVPTRTAGYAVGGSSTNGAYTMVRRCTFFYQWDCINVGNQLMNVTECEMRYFAHSGIVVNHNSDHQISMVVCDNNAGALPTGGGIDVLVTASLVMNFLNIIHSNNALWLRPVTSVTVPSVKAANCFFDTSVVGLMINGAGFVLRSEFTNCWFSSMSSAGISLTPSTASGADGLTFVNCDIYNNVGGTTNGVITNANVGKWKMIGCSVAGWTTGISLVAGTAHYPQIINNTIGSVSAFGVNTLGINIAAGAYKGFLISGNDCADNTTVLTNAATITTAGSQFRIVDNPGINPKGAIATPAFPASGTAVTNLTGYRVLVGVKGGTSTAVAINGVAAVLSATPALIPLDPGGTVAITFTVAPTWQWVAN